MPKLKNMRHLSYVILFMFILVLTGCIKRTFLNNGHTRVATNIKVYKNKMYFDHSVLTQFDTSAIYEELYLGILARNNYNDANNIYGVYRFYGNGNYSLFHLNRDDKILTQEMFDPTYTGWRGVLYKKENKILGDLITQTGQMSWAIGKQTQQFTISGDTLIVEVKNLHKNIYVKRPVYNYLLNHDANW